MKEIRIAWIYPAIPFGAYWQPIINELITFFENTKFYTGCPWKGFSAKDPKNAAFKIVGNAKYIASTKKAQGYNRAFIYASPTIIKPLLETKPHIIFSSAFSIWTVLALLLKSIGRWKVVIIYDGSSPNSDFQDSFWRSSFRKLMVKAADAFVANSKAAKTYLIEGLKAPENSVYNETYLVPDANTLLRSVDTIELFDLKLQRPTFLFVGQIIQRKGINNLLKACSILQSYGYENYSILIIGDGENRDKLVDFSNKNNLDRQVRWVGWVEYEKLGSYFQLADVFVFPTFEDVWGMAVLEAMVFGKAILCSKGANAAEMIIPGTNGYIFDPLDPTELARYMRYFIDDPKLSAQMGQESQEIISNYTPLSAASKLSKITLSLLNR